MDLSSKSRNLKILFLNLKSNKHSRTRNYYNGLLKQGYSVSWLDLDSSTSLFEKRNEIRAFHSKDFVTVIASPSHVLVVYFFIAFLRRPVLDAGWMLSDGVIASRKEFGFLGAKFLKFYFLDFMVLHLSSKVFLESKAQVSRIRRKYLVGRGRLHVLYTGVDENRFQDSTFSKQVLTETKEDKSIVLFRGGAQTEAGLEVLEMCAKNEQLNKNVLFKVVSQGYSVDSRTNQIEVENRYLSDVELARNFIESSLVLGQLSNHKRLRFTIPHKFFEAAFFGRPYLTSNYGLVGTFGLCGLVYTFEGGSHQDLADRILQIFEDVESAELMGQKLKEWYETNASQFILADKFASILGGD